jgi:hypothetical protein
VTRDTPRGPTATELRRRALAHEARIVASDPLPDYPDFVQGAKRCAYCGRLSPIGCDNAPCSFHSR